MSNHLLTLIPVVGDQNDFLGSISSNHLMNMIALHTGFNQSGAVIVLQMNDFDYQLSQIAQIIDNNAKILGFYTETAPDGNQIRVTLKLNQSKLGPVLQTFSGMTIILMKFLQMMNNNEYQDRYDHLMNYLGSN